MTQPPIPLAPATLIGLFRGAIDAPLVERGAARGLELLGRPQDFWSSLAATELQRMAAGGNGNAQAELAWRHAHGDRVARMPATALRWALRSAETDCATGLAVLGWLLQHGCGLPRDTVEAARLFALSAARGVPLAQYWMGRLQYLGGEGVAPDYPSAVLWLQQAAAQGHAAAADLLARCHFFGRGVAEDRAAACRLWREAAAGGVASASYSLGMCLYGGVAAVAEPRSAIVHFRAAADGGVAAAMFLLGQCATFGVGMARDPEAGLDWYRRAAEGGSREAEFELGECLAYGVGSGGRDLVAALRWWKAAAANGHVRAHLKIGHACRWGDGVAEDKRAALGWYRRAAELGDASAWVWLGECHERGEGGEVDPAAARDAYARAAAAGDAHGMAEHGRCLLHGIGGAAAPERGEALLLAAQGAGWQQARGELERFWFGRAMALLRAAGDAGDPGLKLAVACLRRAATSGHRRAAFMLGECLRHGTGTAIDPAEALAWLRRAAALPDAKVIVGDLLYFGQGVPRDPAEAFRWYQRAAIEHRDAYAMYSCGYCLLHGEGVEHDLRAALRWLRRAAQQGEVDACHELGMAYLREGRTGRRLARRWLRAAADHGHAGARRVLDEVAAGLHSA